MSKIFEEPNFFGLPTEKQTEIMMKAIHKSNQTQQEMSEKAKKLRKSDIESNIERQGVDIGEKDEI